MNMEQATHLKNITNGRTFLRTDILAARPDMVPCTAGGEIVNGHTGDSEPAVGIDRPVTKYLGSQTNGVLYRYSEILAQRPEMISINTVKQWETMRDDGSAPAVAADVVAPKLERAVAVTPAEAVKPADASPDDAHQLPDTKGMKAREAKTLLSDWALLHFKEKIDRRPALNDVIAHCQSLLDGSPQTAAG
jgi:hypothetical protein